MVALNPQITALLALKDLILMKMVSVFLYKLDNNHAVQVAQNVEIMDLVRLVKQALFYL